MFKKRVVKQQKESKRRLFDEDPLYEDAASDTSFLKQQNKRLKLKSDTSASSTAAKPTRETVFNETSHAIRDKDEATTTIKKNTGPMKAVPVNVRTTTLTDFQPDICKDYQQTGYCGYGDTCKFLHIRDESKAKKPIEKEWKNVELVKDKAAAASQVPFKCLICKKDYNSPVKTSCGHIFCRSCFIARNKRNGTCIVCGKDTGGIFHPVSAKDAQVVPTV